MHLLPETAALSIERKKMITTFVSPSRALDGVYETLTPDLELEYFSVRNGERREIISEGWALRYVCDAAGPDSSTRKKRDANQYRGRRRFRLEGFLSDAARNVLRATSGGLRISCDLSATSGSMPTVSSRQVGVGKKSGWTVYQTRHEIRASQSDFENAVRSLGSPIVDDLLVLSAEPDGIVESKDGCEVRPIWRLKCVRQARSDAEIVERFYVDDDTDWILAKTRSGATLKLRNLLAERKERAEMAAARESERVNEEAYDAERNRLRELEAAMAISDEDLDAITAS